MEADGFEARGEENALGDDDGDESHHGEVGVEGLEVSAGRVTAERCRLAERESELERPGLERIGAIAGCVGRREDVDNLLAAGMQQFEGFFSESRLAD